MKSLSYTAGLILAPLLATAAVDAEEVFSLGRVEVIGEGANALDGTARMDAETMRWNESTTVAEAASTAPGVVLSTVGARREQVIFVRGYDMRQVPLFVDGVPVYVPYDGYVDLGRFTTFDLAELSVSKGFSSVLYGPNTLGGAVNLVSRRPSKALEGSAGATYGRGDREGSDRREVWANVGANRGSWYAQLGASGVDSDAFPLADDFEAKAAEDGGLRNNAYQRDRKYSAKLGFIPDQRSEYVIGYVNQQGEKGTPPYAGSDASQKPRYWQWPYWDKESLYVISDSRFDERRYLKSRFYYDRFANSLHSYDDATYTTITKPYAFRSHYDDAGYGGSVEYGFPVTERQMLRTALHLKYDEHEERNSDTTPLIRFADRTVSAAVEDTVTLSAATTLVAGVSYDRRDSLKAENFNSATQTISDFPDNDAAAWNPQIGLYQALSDTTRVRFTAARKSRLPTIKDRYSYRLGTAIPNPDLDPEHANHYEAGIEQRFGTVASAAVALFRSDITDSIQSVNINPTTTQMQNVGKAQASGVELALRAYPQEWLELGLNVNYLDKRNVTSPQVRVTDVPMHVTSVYAAFTPTDEFKFTVSAQGEDGRNTSTDGVRTTDGFTVFNLKAAYRISEALSVDGGVENATDELYEYNEGFPEPGRVYFAGVKAVF